MTTRRDFCAAALPVTLGLAGLAATGSRPALAQAWPTKPIRVVVNFPPGGTGSWVNPGIPSKRFSSRMPCQWIVEG